MLDKHAHAHTHTQMLDKHAERERERERERSSTSILERKYWDIKQQTKYISPFLSVALSLSRALYCSVRAREEGPAELS
jgi:hypothetical protein